MSIVGIKVIIKLKISGGVTKAKISNKVNIKIDLFLTYIFLNLLNIQGIWKNIIKIKDKLYKNFSISLIEPK
jgi:hypothetical protein